MTEITETINELDNICKLLLGKNQLDNREKENLLKRLERLRDYLAQNSSKITLVDIYNEIKYPSNEFLLREMYKMQSEMHEMYSEIRHTSIEMHQKILSELNIEVYKSLRKVYDEQNTSSSRNLVTPVGRGARGEGINYLKEFTKDAKELIIIDPYILIVKSEDYIDSYLKEFFNAINIRTNKNNLESIRIIYDKWEPEISDIIRDTMHDNTNSRKVFKFRPSKKIHDRIWIKDKKTAMFVGTSFNGLGNKLNVLLPLPGEDLRNVLNFLNSENLLNDKPKRIISI